MAHLQLDNHKLLYHLDILNAWTKGKDFYPIYVGLSPSSCCNFKCCFCAYSYLPKKSVFLTKAVVHKALKEFKEMGVKAIFYSGEGEPFMNKSLPEMIVDTYENSIDAAVNTNGLLLTKSIAKNIVDKLTFIRFSVNAGDSASYKNIHGCNKNVFEIVMNNIADVVKFRNEKKAKTTIGIQSLLLKENINTMINLARILKKIKVDYLAIKPFLKHPDIDFNDDVDICEYETIMKRLESISTKTFKVIIRRNAFNRNKARNYEHCLSVPFMAEIDSSGDIYPCGPYLGHSEFVYGNIYKNSFKEIWNSEKCREVKDYIITKLDVSKCMPNCRNDAVNRFLWQLKNPPEHINFI